MKKNILFVINPISGGKSKVQVEPLISSYLDHSQYEYEIAYSNAIDHARKLSKSAAYLGFDGVIAVGGDGTVHEVAKGIFSLNSAEVVLGIIPYGSGNGLARHLQIPMSVKGAIDVLNKQEIKVIDAAILNDEPFFNVAGVGFDAHISTLFATNKKRGLWGYVKSILRELRHYQSEEYRLIIDQKEMKKNAFMISIANSSQFGNNAHIAPLADISDGLLDVAIVKPFPIYQIPFLVWRLMARSVHRSSFVELIKGKEITIERKSNGPLHLDGEPFGVSGKLNIKIKPASIKVFVPKFGKFDNKLDA